MKFHKMIFHTLRWRHLLVKQCNCSKKDQICDTTFLHTNRNSFMKMYSIKHVCKILHICSINNVL